MKLLRSDVEDVRELTRRQGRLDAELDAAFDVIVEKSTYQPSPEPERLKIDMDWEDAVKQALREADA